MSDAEKSQSLQFKMKTRISSAVPHQIERERELFVHVHFVLVHFILALFTLPCRQDLVYLIRSEITQPQDGQVERMMKNMANRREF